MSHVEPVCRHQKAYSGEVLPLVERWFWICTECLEAGSDRFAAEPPLQPEVYWRAMRRLQPECWIPATYRKTIG